MAGEITHEAVMAHLAARGLGQDAYARVAGELYGHAEPAASKPVTLTPEQQSFLCWTATHGGEVPPSTWG
jgi:hypothetical protein